MGRIWLGSTVRRENWLWAIGNADHSGRGGGGEVVGLDLEAIASTGFNNFGAKCSNHESETDAAACLNPTTGASTIPPATTHNTHTATGSKFVERAAAKVTETAKTTTQRSRSPPPSSSPLSSSPSSSSSSSPSPLAVYLSSLTTAVSGGGGGGHERGRGRGKREKRAQNARTVPHAHGRPFLSHLVGVGDLLARWCQPLDLVAAGFAHSIYATEIFPVGLFALSERHLVRQLLSSSFQTRTSRGRNVSTVGSSGGSSGGEGGRQGETCEEVCRDDGCEEAARGAEALVFLYCTVSQVGVYQEVRRLLSQLPPPPPPRRRRHSLNTSIRERNGDYSATAVAPAAADTATADIACTEAAAARTVSTDGDVDGCGGDCGCDGDSDGDSDGDEESEEESEDGVDESSDAALNGDGNFHDKDSNVYDNDDDEDDTDENGIKDDEDADGLKRLLLSPGLHVRNCYSGETRVLPASVAARLLLLLAADLCEQDAWFGLELSMGCLLLAAPHLPNPPPLAHLLRHHHHRCRGDRTMEKRNDGKDQKGKPKNFSLAGLTLSSSSSSPPPPSFWLSSWLSSRLPPSLLLPSSSPSYFLFPTSLLSPEAAAAPTSDTRTPVSPLSISSSSSLTTSLPSPWGLFTRPSEWPLWSEVAAALHLAPPVPLFLAYGHRKDSVNRSSGVRSSEGHAKRLLTQGLELLFTLRRRQSTTKGTHTASAAAAPAAAAAAAKVTAASQAAGGSGGGCGGARGGVEVELLARATEWAAAAAWALGRQRRAPSLNTNHPRHAAANASRTATTTTTVPEGFCRWCVELEACWVGIEWELLSLLSAATTGTAATTAAAGSTPTAVATTAPKAKARLSPLAAKAVTTGASHATSASTNAPPPSPFSRPLLSPRYLSATTEASAAEIEGGFAYLRGRAKAVARAGGAWGTLWSRPADGDDAAAHLAGTLGSALQPAPHSPR